MPQTNESSTYWAKRRLLASIDGEQAMMVSAEIANDAFVNAQAKVINQLESFYSKYAKDHQISLAEAQQALNPKEKKSFDQQNASYIDNAKKFPAQTPNGEAAQKKLVASLKRQSSKAYVSKLQALDLNIEKAVTDGYLGADAELGTTLGEVYEAGQLTTAYDIQKQVGVGYSFTTVGGKGLEAAVKLKWNGQNYSDKLWKHKDNLIETLQRVIPQQFVMGRGIEDATKEVMKAMGTSRNNAQRLVRTEVTFASNKGAMDAYDGAGIDQYQFMATLDLRTSEICAELDGQVYLVSGAEPGLNMPPMHPYCRSTTIPWFDPDGFDQYLTDRVHRQGGKTEPIGQYISFKDWVKKFAPEHAAFYDANKKVLFKNVSKPPLDVSQLKYYDWEGLAYEAQYSGDYEFESKLKELGLNEYSPEQIINAWSEREQNESPEVYNRSRFLNSKDTIRIAKRMGLVDPNDYNEFGRPLTVEATFGLDKKLDGLTHQQAFNRVLTGYAVENVYDITIKNLQPPSAYNGTPEDYLLYQARVGLRTLVSSMNNKTGKRYNADDMLIELQDLTNVIEKDPGNVDKTWVEMYSKKSAELAKSELYAKYKDVFQVDGISAEYLAKVVKGKYKTIGEAATVYQQKEALYKLKANTGKNQTYDQMLKSLGLGGGSSSSSTPKAPKINADLTAEEERLAKSKLEFWDEFADPQALKAMLAAAQMPYNGEAADKKYRPSASVFWKNATPEQKSAIYKYTSGSGQFNRPLEGYETNGSWASYDYHPNWKIDQFQNSRKIFDAYDAVNHSVLTEHTRVRRGGDFDELRGKPSSLFPDISSASQLASKVGSVVQINRFLSTGVSPGKGFHGNVEYEIILPKGTHAIYVEPFSSYGRSGGINWDGDPNWQGGLGSEQEMVIQAGTQYLIQDWDGSNNKITLVAIPASQRVLPAKLKESSLAVNHPKNK